MRRVLFTIALVLVLSSVMSGVAMAADGSGIRPMITSMAAVGTKIRPVGFLSADNSGIRPLAALSLMVDGDGIRPD